jgi:hypothetical protein
VPLVAFLAVLDGHKTRRAEKIFFVKKMAVWQIWPLNGPRKWANFFLSYIYIIFIPKLTPRNNDQKGVLNTGAYNFDDIWAFGGPDLVKNGKKIGHLTIKNRPSFKNDDPLPLPFKSRPKRGSNEPPPVRVRAMWPEKNRSLPWP